MHPYDGVPGSAAATGLTVVGRRQQGLKGGAMEQVFVAALVVEEGESLLSSMGGKWPELMKPNVRQIIFALCIRLPF